MTIVRRRDRTTATRASTLGNANAGTETGQNNKTAGRSLAGNEIVFTSRRALPSAATLDPQTLFKTVNRSAERSLAATVTGSSPV